MNLQSTVEELSPCEEWTVEERAQISDEANRILADPSFRNSKRCLALFRRLVERSLAGDHDAVKERILGVEVFGRIPSYDTATDPVVRMTANEIRKRLAQWYQEPDQNHRVKVRLNSGTYLLKFEFALPELAPKILAPEPKLETHEQFVLPEAETVPAQQPESLIAAESNIQSDVITFKTVARSRNWMWISAATVMALAAFLATRYSDVFQSRDYAIWRPLFDSTVPLILSIPEQAPQAIAEGPLQWQLNADAIANRVAPVGTVARNTNSITTMADAATAQSITQWVSSHGQKSVLRGSSAMTMRDLRQGSVVLIGGFNPWSLVLLSNLRFSIRIDPATHVIWIQDAQDVSKRNWMLDANDQPKDIDYAIISRLFDTETGHWILSLSGMRKQGTRAARELLINSSYAQLLPKEIKSTGNFQIVLKTSIINGSADPPQILAVHTW